MKYFAGTFNQRIRENFTAENGLDSINITAVAIGNDGALYAGTQDGLYIGQKGKFTKSDITEKVSFIYACKCGKTFVVVDKTVYTLEKGKIKASQSFNDCPVAIDRDNNNLWLVTADVVYKYNGKEFVRYTRIEYGQVTAMTAFADDKLYVVAPVGILAMHGKRPHWGLLCHLNCNMPECTVNCVASDKYGHVWVGTDKGMLLYDGHSKWFTKETMPYLTQGNILSITIGENGARYIATDYGIVIQDGVKESCYVPGRWIPDSEITCIAANDDGSEIWVGTKDGGLVCIKSVKMTLEEKAAILEEIMEKYYIREGYCTSLHLHKPCDIEASTPEISDNDGLWTADYVATQAYRYAVTKAEDALEKARRGAKAMLKLMSITGIPGFTARAYRRPGEPEYGNGNIEWHHTVDEIGDLEWKGETSSDEMVGHFFGISLYYDLCADEAEKAEIAKAIAAIVDHVIEHNFTLCDFDGKSTTWAHWAPDELNRDDMWYNERGVNSFELLMMLKTAYHMTGDEKYEKVYFDLVTKEHYALNSARHKVEDAHVTHIDDNLCFSTAITLFRYENDPFIRQLLMFGLKHHWEYERIERAPLWNLVYGALSGAHCDLDIAVQSLEEIPLDFVCHNIKNSRRPDLEWDSGQEFFGGDPQLKHPLPYDEKPINNFDHSPFEPDECRPFTFARCPVIYLMPYWFGRYHGLIGD